MIAVAAPVAYPMAQRLGPGSSPLASLLKMSLAIVLVVVRRLGVVETDEGQNQRPTTSPLVEDFSSGALARTWKLWASVEAGQPEQ